MTIASTPANIVKQRTTSKIPQATEKHHFSASVTGDQQLPPIFHSWMVKLEQCLNEHGKSVKLTQGLLRLSKLESCSIKMLPFWCHSWMANAESDRSSATEKLARGGAWVRVQTRSHKNTSHKRCIPLVPPHKKKRTKTTFRMTTRQHRMPAPTNPSC